MPDVSRDDLRRVAVFHDLPDEQLDWFLEHATELRLQPGEVGTRAGDPADRMVVILEGQMQGRIEGTSENVFTANAGSVTGMLPYSRMTIFPATTRAVLPSRILVFPASLFDDLLSHMPELARRLVATMVDRTRETTRAEQQRDRLAALGKLSAGLAHELNNPAAAARRTAQQLRSAVGEFRTSVSKLEGLRLTEDERAAIETFEATCCLEATETEALRASEREDEIESILRQHGIENSWQYGAALVDSWCATQPAQPTDGRRPTKCGRGGAEASFRPDGNQ